MIVCLIAEGAYPYVTGGVSSWMHQLITELKDIEFKVVSIMPSYKEKPEVRYYMPKNLLDIKTIYLDDYKKVNDVKKKGNFHLKYGEKRNIFQFLNFNPNVNWKEIINLISNEGKLGSTIDFLQSKVFWDIVVNLYEERYSFESFNTFFWTIRTMMVPFMHLIQQPPVSADIYHTVSTGYAGILGVSYKSNTHKPLLLTEHGIYAREREEEILKAKWVTRAYKKLWIDFFYFLSKASYMESDKIISLFEKNKNIQLSLGAPSNKTKVIPNGVDISKYSLEKEEHSGYNIGAVLRVVPIKDVMTLIRAFKIVKDTLKSSKLYLIGPTDEDEDYYKQCKSLVDLLKLNDDIVFTGRTDVRKYLKIVDVMVLTSISEGQPLVILEAMSSAIPVVSTDVGSCRELLEKNYFEGDCGVITNLASPNETAHHVIRLLKDPDLRREMGYNGRLRVERAYSKEMFIDKYRKVYNELR